MMARILALRRIIRPDASSGRSQHMHRRAAASGAYRVDHAPLHEYSLYQLQTARRRPQDAHIMALRPHDVCWRRRGNVNSPSELQLVSWPPGGVLGQEMRHGGGARGGEGAGAPATPVALLLMAPGGCRGAMVDRILRADLRSFVSFPPKRRKIVWNFDLSDVHAGPPYCSRRNGSRQINSTDNLPRFFPPAS